MAKLKYNKLIGFLLLLVLVSEIKAKIHEIVQRDQDLAAQLKGGLT